MGALTSEHAPGRRCIEKGAVDKPILLPHKFHDELERVCSETQNHSLRHSEFGVLMKSLQEVRGVGVGVIIKVCMEVAERLDDATYNCLIIMS